MLDIGFSELLLVAIIGLLVLGPERLPRVARTVGYWGGRARSYVRQMSAELEREVQRADVKRQIEESQRILNERIDLDGDEHGDKARQQKTD